LRAEGYLVEVAETGKEAIAKSESTFYNLAIIDFCLPDCEGTKLLASLKEWTPRTRKIMMTGHPTLQNAFEAAKRNADAYITKPIDFEKMLIIIREQLEKQKEETCSEEAKLALFLKEIENSPQASDYYINDERMVSNH